MPSLTVATWNINSVRLRIGLVERFLETAKPDILCLQETKTPDTKFPFKPLHDLGYEHIAMHGQKGYHGVATISRVPFTASDKMGFCGKGDARHIQVTVADDIEIHNFYVPSGGDEPDPEKNEKFDHKLKFLTEMKECYGSRRGKKTAKLLLVGDLNVAPLEHDVWSHKQMLGVVSHTPVEVDHLSEAQASHDFVDVTRRDLPEPEKVYTWWSYRAKDWRASNRGRRLDHIWATPTLADRTSDIRILSDARDWPRPSDHVPVLAKIDI